VGIIIISATIAIYKATTDFLMTDLPEQALPARGGLYPVTTVISSPALCLPPAANLSADGTQSTAASGGGGGVTTGAVQKGMTTLRIVSRIAIGLRILRIAMKAARIARSLLGREKPTVLDGHESGLHAVCLGRLRGEAVLVTACDDGYARLWDPTGLLRTLRPPADAGPWWRRALGMDV
jgi:hypothetical protein